MRANLLRGVVIGAALLASGAAEAQVRHHGLKFWYSGGYRNPALGGWSNGRFFPNTHNPHLYVHGPGVAVRH